MTKELAAIVLNHKIMYSVSFDAFKKEVAMLYIKIKIDQYLISKYD